MGDPDNIKKYDEVLSSILINEKSILGFLSAIFNFLGRRTDFYYVPKGPYENMGFPPGMAEELVLKVLRSCDPNNWKNNVEPKSEDLSDEIMCSTVAQEVEVIDENDKDNIAEELLKQEVSNVPESNLKEADYVTNPDDYTPPVIPVQKNSETYNGAEREQYCWSQTIAELEVTAKLPPDIKSSKDLKVVINAGDIAVTCRNGDVIIKDKLPFKIKAIDSFWSISEGKLIIHLEKVQDRWWNRLLESEEPIDLSKIDCSRPLDDLPEEHIAKVRELQWNQEQKRKGLPTSDELKNLEILKRAWNAEGSPFKGQKFDPSVLHKP